MFVNFSCQENTNRLPNVYVNIVLDLNKPEFSELNTPGNFIYITGGIAGIIVYHDLDGQYKAFDRACPYDFYSCGGRVEVKDIGTGVVVDSSCCGSEFSITNEGAVLKGPARTPLKRYRVQYNPEANTLYITSY